jgi:molecular chaperone DnaK (HSP70)
MHFQTLSTKTTIDDVNGKKMEAKVIFAMSIRYLREHVLDVVRQRTADIGEHDFLYVITVPAIWDDSAKQFMREAAVQVLVLFRIFEDTGITLSVSQSVRHKY